MRELTLTPAVVRYRRERWATPSGETVLAPLPAGIVGGFGPGLRRFLLVAHAQGQVTTERLVALLAGIGIEISKRQVVRLLTSRLDDLIAEDREVLRAGLAVNKRRTGTPPTRRFWQQIQLLAAVFERGPDSALIYNQCFSMFQNTMTGACSTPVTLARRA